MQSAHGKGDSMKKILVIDACVRGEMSRTKKLLDKALSVLRGTHPDWIFETVCLPEAGLRCLDRQSLEERDDLLAKKQVDHPRFALAHQFREADGIIVAAPFWDLSFPAMLKVYIENVSADGLTFFCDAEGLHGMCKASWMLHLATRGGLYEAASWLQDSAYLEQMCRFFGIGSYTCVSADGIDIVGLPADRIMEEALEKTEKVCKELS